MWTPYFRIMSQYDPTFDVKINVGNCDLYFMVQWFCLISWRLFDIWTPYFGIMSKYDPMFDLEKNVGHCDLYFIVHWFCLISLYLMDECHTFGKWVGVIRSSDLSFFNVCSEKHFSFIGKARLRRAMLSCHSSYHSYFHFVFFYLSFFYISLNFWSLIGVYNFPVVHLFVTNGQITCTYAGSWIINQLLPCVHFTREIPNTKKKIHWNQDLQKLFPQEAIFEPMGYQKQKTFELCRSSTYGGLDITFQEYARTAK